MAKEIQAGNWFIVAGYHGETLNAESSDFVVLKAQNLQEALQQAGAEHPGFNPVNGLTEQQLQGYQHRINVAKASASS